MTNLHSTSHHISSLLKERERERVERDEKVDRNTRKWQKQKKRGEVDTSTQLFQQL